MKYALSSYSFYRLPANEKKDFLSLISRTKSLGFDAIEFTDLVPPEGMDNVSYGKQLRQKAEALGVEICAYTVGTNFLNGSNGDLAIEINRIKQQVDTAEALGVKKMRHDATSGDPYDCKHFRSFDSVLPRLSEGCRVITEYAASKGIATMVENHGMFCQEPERVEKLLSAVNHPNFGWLVDIGNFLCADVSPALACSIAAPYAFHVHVKDFHFKSGQESNPGQGFFRSRGGHYLRGAIIGHGCVPVTQCLSRIKAAGYDDVLTVEFEGLEYPDTGIKIGLENLKRFWEEC